MGLDLRGKEIGTGFHQRKNGKYEGRFINRFGKRVSLYDWDLKALKKRIADAEYENRKMMNVVDEGTTLDEWFSRWMNTYKIPNIRQNTKMAYEHIYSKHISPFIGSMPLTKIRKIHVQDIINSLKKRGYQWETQNKVRMLLNDMYCCAIADEYAQRNPCRGVKIFGKKSEDEPRFLTKDEQALFFEACAGRWYDNLFNVAINTGLRPGELAALTWDDIDLRNMVIHVRHTLVYQKYDGDPKKIYHLENTKTNGGKRTVPINETCLKYLKRQFVQKNILSRKMKSTSELGDRLFVTRRNNPINVTDYNHAIREILKDVNEKLDLLEQIEEFSGHTFRHTFATRCIESGIRPKTLQKFLGHKSIQTTMDMYVHIDNHEKHQQMELLENDFSPWENLEDSYERELRIVHL